MRVILAQHQRAAKAIALYLSGDEDRDPDDVTGGFKVRDDIIIALGGRLLTEPKPEAYDPKYREFKMEHLPIIPTEWKRELTENQTGRAAIEGLKEHLPKADAVINACEFDQHGQLCADEALEYLKYEGKVQRAPVQSYDKRSLYAAFALTHDNERNRALGIAELARLRGDWGLNFNLSRRYTLAMQAATGNKDAKVGLSRTIAGGLWLLERRETEIATFVPVETNIARVQTRGAGTWLTFRWTPPAALLDARGNLLRAEPAHAALANILRTKRVRVIDMVEQEDVHEPPLPFNMTTLLAAAFARLPYEPRMVIDAAEALGSQHRLITQPKTESQRFPGAFVRHREAVLSSVAVNLPELYPLISALPPQHANGVFAPGALAYGEMESAIVPTETRMNIEKLPQLERSLYELICRQTIACCLPPVRKHIRILVGEAGGEYLNARVETVIHPGWSLAFPRETTEERQDEYDVAIGQQLAIEDGYVKAEGSSAPRRFTNATLILALNNVRDHVANPALRDRLGPHAKLGRAHTQATIVKSLADNNYVELRIPDDRHGVMNAPREIKPNEAGLALARALPEELRGPALSADFETNCERIARGKSSMEAFLDNQAILLRSIFRRPLNLQVGDAWGGKSKEKTKERGQEKGQDKGQSRSAGGKERTPVKAQ